MGVAAATGGAKEEWYGERYGKGQHKTLEAFDKLIVKVKRNLK